MNALAVKKGEDADVMLWECAGRYFGTWTKAVKAAIVQAIRARKRQGRPLTVYKSAPGSAPGWLARGGGHTPIWAVELGGEGCRVTIIISKADSRIIQDEIEAPG